MLSIDAKMPNDTSLWLIAQPSKYQFDFATLSKSGYTELSIKGGHSCGVAA